VKEIDTSSVIGTMWNNVVQYAHFLQRSGESRICQDDVESNNRLEDGPLLHNVVHLGVSTENGEMGKKTVGYIRVSTSHQVEDGISLEAQRARIEAYSNLYGLHLLKIVEDAGLSGRTIAGRPGIQKVLDLVTSRKIGHLVVVKLDRLARNVKECCEIVEHLEKTKVSLHSVTEKIDTGNANGRLFFTILAAMAAWEREVNGERVKAALSHKKMNNERVSRYSPYGFVFSHDGKLLEDDQEQEVIKRIYELRDCGRSVRRITRDLNDLGYLNRMGNPLQHSLVHKIIQQVR
jgi:site-specific DNA recombinase